MVKLVSPREDGRVGLRAARGLPLCHQSVPVPMPCLQPWEVRDIPTTHSGLTCFCCHRCFCLQSGKSLKCKADLQGVLLTKNPEHAGPLSPAQANCRILTPDHWGLHFRILAFAEKLVAGQKLDELKFLAREDVL